MIRLIFLSASVFNISGGLILIFLLDRIAPLLGMSLTGPPLFTYFAGGTAILFGIGYYAASKNIARQRLLVALGTALKFWAFIISGYCLLIKAIPLAVFFLFGVANLFFAILFVWAIVTIPSGGAAD